MPLIAVAKVYSNIFDQYGSVAVKMTLTEARILSRLECVKIKAKTYHDFMTFKRRQNRNNVHYLLIQFSSKLDRKISF